MTLDEALDHLWREYVHCDRRDIHTVETRQALHTILAAHPHTKRQLVEYWKLSEFEPDLDPWRYNGKTAMLHPLLRRLDRACGRQWTINGYVKIQPER